MNDAIAVARAVLERIIEQLAPLEEDLLSGTNGYFIGDISEAEYNRRRDRGLVSLQYALREARAALESDDPETIVVAALDCQARIIDGKSLYYRYLRITESRRRDSERQQFVNLYWEKVRKGTPYLAARNQCIDEAARKGVTFPRSIPSQNEWFPKPKKVK